ncbi:MAG: FadR/GntR family transcriptional regulator [Faecalibacterium sp.]
MPNEFLKPLQMRAIPSGSVVDQIIEQIRQALTSGRFKRGDKLPSEFELMEELQVSRNSLREAMRVLGTMGVIEVRRGDGTYFCTEIKPSIMDFVVYSMLLEESNASEIVQLRQTLDEDVLDLAMQHCTSEDITQLESYIGTMHTAFANGDIPSAAKADYDFHIYLAHCARNRFLEHIVVGVYALFEPSIERNIRTETLFALADRHHQEIVQCLKEKDATAIPQVVARSLSSWRANIEKD